MSAVLAAWLAAVEAPWAEDEDLEWRKSNYKNKAFYLR